LVKHHITQVCQPPYSPDLAPCDFWGGGCRRTKTHADQDGERARGVRKNEMATQDGKQARNVSKNVMASQDGEQTSVKVYGFVRSLV